MLSSALRALEVFLEPVSLIWFALLGGCIAGIMKRQKKPAVFCGVLALVLWFCGSGIASSRMRRWLERSYRTQDVQKLANSDAVVMLGTVLGASRMNILHLNLNEAGDRAFTAIELVRQQKAPVLVLGGATQILNSETLNEGTLLKRWINDWGLLSTNTIALEGSLSTREEAVQVQALAARRGWKRIILVTSAFHMKRAEAVFRKVGLEVAPFACDFAESGKLKQTIQFSVPILPQAASLAAFDRYSHEILGLVVYRLRGWM